MPGISFDDLIPKQGTAASPATGGLTFDDLIPPAKGGISAPWSADFKARWSALPADKDEIVNAPYDRETEGELRRAMTPEQRMRRAARIVSAQTQGPEYGFGELGAGVTRRVAHGVTLGLSEELAAAARSAAGDESYTDALRSEDAKYQRARKVTGVAGDVTELLGSLAPGAGAGALTTRLVGAAPQIVGGSAPVGARLLHGAKQVGANATLGYGMGTAADYGAQDADSKSVGKALTSPSAAVGAAIPVALSTAGTVASGASKMARSGADRVRNYARHKAVNAGGAYTPTQHMEQRVADEIARRAAEGGATNMQALDAQVAAGGLDDTAVALANANNDRLQALARDAAAHLDNPNQGGANIWDAYAQSQATTRGGHGQAEAFLDRVNRSAHATTHPDARLADISVERKMLNTELDRISKLRTPMQLRGLAELVDSTPETRNAWMLAARSHSLPGGRHVVVQNPPLPPSLHAQAMARWEGGGSVGPKPRAIEDGVHPVLYKEFRRQVSEMAKDPLATAKNELGRNALRSVQGIATTGGAPRPAREIEDAMQALQDLHAEQEALTTGRGYLTANPTAKTEAVAQFRNSDAVGRTHVKHGVIHGLGDQVRKNADNLSKLERLFENPDVRSQYNFMTRAPKAAPHNANNVQAGLNRLGASQDRVNDLMRVAEGRRLNDKTAVDAAMKAGLYRNTVSKAFSLGQHVITGRNDQSYQHTLARMLTATDRDYTRVRGLISNAMRREGESAQRQQLRNIIIQELASGASRNATGE